jgi:hypothetical protein
MGDKELACGSRVISRRVHQQDACWNSIDSYLRHSDPSGRSWLLATSLAERRVRFAPLIAEVSHPPSDDTKPTADLPFRNDAKGNCKG